MEHVFLLELTSEFDLYYHSEIEIQSLICFGNIQALNYFILDQFQYRIFGFH